MKSILRQSSFLIIAQVFGKIIGFFYTIFLARALGVADFGLYSLALTYFSLFVAFSDFGFSRFLIRELSLGKLSQATLLSNVAILRLAITSILFAISSLVLYTLDPDKIRISLILLALLSIYSFSLSQTLDTVFIAKKKLQFSSIALLVLNISTIIFGIILVNLGFGNTGAVTGLILGHTLYLVILLALLKFQKTKLFADIKLGVIKQVLKGSIPYGLLSILGLLYFKIDVLFLAYLKGNFETGIYSAGYKFLESIVFVPNALSLVLFPIFANFHRLNLGELRKLYNRSFRLMFILGVIVLAFYNIVVPPIIKIFLPNYVQSIGVIRILSLAIPFMFVYVPLSSIILSTDKYLKQLIAFSLIPLSFNIIFNLLMIPKFGFIGASWVTTLSDIISFIVTIFLIKRYVLR